MCSLILNVDNRLIIEYNVRWFISLIWLVAIYEGAVDPTHIYEYEKTHETQHAAVLLHSTKERQMIAEAMQYVMYTIIAIVSIMILYGGMYYCCFYGKSGKERSATDYIAI